MRRVSIPHALRSEAKLLRDKQAHPRLGGMLVVPKILGVDAWEALAVPAQDALIASGLEDRALRGQEPR